MSNFQPILDAIDKYAEQTGINLKENPFAERVKGCDSPSAVLSLLQESLKEFKEYRDTNRKLIECVSPVVQFVHAFSGILGEAASLIPFPPAKLIFAGIDVLFTAANGVSASYDALLELFECLGNFLNRLHVYSEISLDPLMMDIVTKIMVELILILAVAKKQIRRGRLKQFAKHVLGDSEIEAILKRLDRLTQEEARMTVAQTLAIVHGLLNNMKIVIDGGEASTSAIRQTLVVMQEVASEINKMKRNQLQKDARGWISPPDPSKNHVVARRIHSGESAVWFTQGRTFKEWDLTGGLLWIHGKPGSGKSILCSSIIERATMLRNEGLGLVAYYYFDFRDTAKQDIRGLLSSLIVQLSAKSDSCYDILSDLYSKHDIGLHLPDDDSLTQCLKDMLEPPLLPPIYLIIDALDECPDISGAPSPRELVLDLIVELVESHFPSLRICVMSRPESDIQEVLGSLASYSVSLHDEDGQRQDIADYISFTVQSDRKMRKWRTEDKQLVIDALTQRADGMFRWVFCQIEVLRGCFPPTLRRALEELPKTLDTTYERILLGIETAKRSFAYRLLQCIAFSIRPLRVEELAEILAVKVDDGEDTEYDCDWRPEDARQAVFSACSSLITIINVDGVPRVQFSHFSVKEFLTSSRLSKAGDCLSLYHLVPSSAHALLSRACLSVLLNLSDEVDRSVVAQRPFSIYAAQYWVNHAKSEGVLTGIQGLVERLFDSDSPYFATWVWIYDIDRPWKGLTATVRPTEPEVKPLYYAALCGFRGLVEQIAVSHQTDVDARGGDHGTALKAALSNGELEIARVLLQNGADVNILDSGHISSLYSAAQAGHRAVVELLLQHQADITFRTDAQYMTSLHVAVQRGELDICRILLEHGADVASKTINGWTPLHFASRHGHFGIVQELLVYGADVNSHNGDLWTPLHMASQEHLEVVQFLTQHGAALDKTNSRQETALHVASRWGKLKIARFLIERGANVNCKDKDGHTPLHSASQRGHLHLVKLFLQEVGVDVDIRNANEETPLVHASGYGKFGVVSFLIEVGADVNGRDKQDRTPLHTAAGNGHLDVVRFLLDHRDVSVQVRDRNHYTPLILASFGGHLDVSQYLIEHGADVNSFCGQGWTSLHLASRDGHVRVVQLLLDNGACHNVQNMDLWTPLHLASARGHFKVAELLIDWGAGIDARDEKQTTPLHLASGYGSLDAASLLIKSGADFNSQDNMGCTPSHAAARNGHTRLVELLLVSGADVNVRNKSEKTPFDLACENGKRDVAIFIASRLELSLPDIVGFVPSETQGSLPDEQYLEAINSLHSGLVNGHVDVIQRQLDRGADVNERNDLLQTPLQVASGRGPLEIAMTLIKYGADVNSRDDIGWTPLLTAAQYGQIDAVRLLLDNGADIHATEREGTTALHIASGWGHLDLLKLLLERGADSDVQRQNVFGRTPAQHALLYGHREIAQFLSDC